MLHTPEFWVAVSFVIFAGLIVYMGVPGTIASALDARADRISKELAEAQRLREEAQALLARYEAKREEAGHEAAEIVRQAKSDAEALAGEARKKLTESLERRSRMAEDKIAQAEAQAVKEVRAAASELAIAAAERLIAGQMKGEAAAKLIDESIAGLKGKLN